MKAGSAETGLEALRQMQYPRSLYHLAGRAEANEQWWTDYLDRLVRRRAHDDAWSGALKARSGCSLRVYREVGDRGITVNNVQPGPIDTDLNPESRDWAVPQKAATALNRYGKVQEVAALVAFIASPEASYITGTNLTVKGGTNA